jgi:hypothetical protein
VCQARDGRVGYAHDVRLHSTGHTRPESFIKGFNGNRRDECVTSHVFTSVAGAQVVLDSWREDYNAVRPQSALQDRTPAAVGALWVDSRDARESTAIKKDVIELEIADASVAFQM